jgi:hypothetical protein
MCEAAVGTLVARSPGDEAHRRAGLHPQYVFRKSVSLPVQVR